MHVNFLNTIRKNTLLLLFVITAFNPFTVFAQYQNVRVDNPQTKDAEEVSITINTSSPNYIAAGANIAYFFNSSSSGLNWNQKVLRSAFGVWGDPCLIYDRFGNLYFAHLSQGIFENGYFLDRIVVQKSTDNGQTWSDSAGVGYNPPKQQDKEWLAADMSSQKYKDNLYIAWTQFDSYGSTAPGDSSRILFSRSTDLGESWSQPVRISDRAGDCLDSDSTVEGAVPCVGPNGEVYISWAGPLGIMFDKSTDGGQTFGKDIFVTEQPGGWDFMVSGIYRCNGLPETACDTSHSPYRGTVYVLWSDQRNGTGNTDVFLIKSTDGGNTWGNTVKVNNDNTSSQQFFPWLAIDQTTGYIYVVFYDRRNTVNEATDVYGARSTDGGSTFSNFKISQSSFIPSQSVFFGDYINIAAYAGKVYPIWMRMDLGALSVWTAPFADTSGVLSAEEAMPVPSGFRLEQNYPNPFNPSTVISYSLSRRGYVTLKVYDVLGREVAVLVNGQQQAGKHSLEFNPARTAAGGGLASGIYYYRLDADGYSSSKKMIILK